MEPTAPRRLVILTEGERWPEHIRQAQARGVRVVALNARLSDRSYRRMRWSGPAARLMTGGLDRVLACSAPDAARCRNSLSCRATAITCPSAAEPASGW